MDWAYLLNSFDGRIGRQTFWIAMGVVTVAEIFGHFIAEQVQGDRLSAIVDLAFTYPEFAIAAKRGQDRNMPLWLIGACELPPSLDGSVFIQRASRPRRSAYQDSGLQYATSLAALI